MGALVNRRMTIVAAAVITVAGREQVLGREEPVVAGQAHPAAQRHRLPQQPGPEPPRGLGGNRGREEHPGMRPGAGTGHLKGDRDLQRPARLDVVCAENCIRAGEVHDVRQSGLGFRRPVQDGKRPRRGGRRGMMCDCAVAIGLLDGDERVRGAAPSFRERSGQGHRDLGLAPSGRGAGAPAGREEGAPYACGPGLAGGAVAQAGATGAWPDAVAGTARYGAALAS